MDTYLAHHGVKGQKKGERKYQHYDGTYTELGKERRRAKYGANRTVFVSGSSKTQDENSKYFRKELPDGVRKALDSYIHDSANIVVGDAPGIDRQVQDYLKEKGYDKVSIYGPGKSLRYQADKSWKARPIDASEYPEGSPEWLAKKDKAMEDVATEGLAVVLDNGAKATRNNVKRLSDHGKSVKVYELSGESDELDRFIPTKAVLDQALKENKDQIKILDNQIARLYRKERGIYEKATKGLDRISDKGQFETRYRDAVRSERYQRIKGTIKDLYEKKKQLEQGAIYDMYNEYYGHNAGYYAYLAHHGIKGQKHGVRRALWYPIADYLASLRNAKKSGKNVREEYAVARKRRKKLNALEDAREARAKKAKEQAEAKAAEEKRQQEAKAAEEKRQKEAAAKAEADRVSKANEERVLASGTIQELLSYTGKVDNKVLADALERRKALDRKIAEVTPKEITRIDRVIMFADRNSERLKSVGDAAANVASGLSNLRKLGEAVGLVEKKNDNWFAGGSEAIAAALMSKVKTGKISDKDFNNAFQALGNVQKLEQKIKSDARERADKVAAEKAANTKPPATPAKDAVEKVASMQGYEKNEVPISDPKKPSEGVQRSKFLQGLFDKKDDKKKKK